MLRSMSTWERDGGWPRYPRSWPFIRVTAITFALQASADWEHPTKLLRRSHRVRGVAAQAAVAKLRRWSSALALSAVGGLRAVICAWYTWTVSRLFRSRPCR